MVFRNQQGLFVFDDRGRGATDKDGRHLKTVVTKGVLVVSGAQREAHSGKTQHQRKDSEKDMPGVGQQGQTAPPQATGNLGE